MSEAGTLDATEDRTAAAAEWLVVPIEGVLLRNRLAEERAWASAGHWLSALDGDGEGTRGIDPAALAYDPAALEVIGEALTDGRRVALQIDREDEDAPRIAAHLGLEGAVRVMANADTPAREAAFGAGRFTELPRGPAPETATIARAALKAMRPHQWLKNLLIFVPLFTAHLFTAGALLQGALAFLAFSLVASSVYLLNDLLDLAADRAHPRKRLRPFASGALPLRYAGRLFGGLLVAGLAVGSAVGPLFLLVLVGYYAATVLYSFVLKKRTVIDICALAGLYTLRIVAGGAAAGVVLSVWLLAFSIFLFFALAAIKRQAELVDGLASGLEKAAGRGYRVEDLGLVSQMALSASYVAVLVMALYISSDEVQALYSWPAALWGICLVLLYWLSRMVMKTHRGEMDDDPILFTLRDRVSLICVALMVGIAVLGALV